MFILRRLFLLAVAIQLLSALPAAADFRVCHDADQDVMLAYSYYDQRQQGWFIAGWFKVEPRSCTTLTTGDVQGGKFYVYGEIPGTTVKWTGDFQLCVERPSAFRFRNEGQSCAETQKYSEVRTGNDSDYTYTLNINAETRRTLAPSFNCSTSRSPTEQTICRHPQLAELDREMAARFSEELSDLGDTQKQALRGAQRTFLLQRNQCGADATCILSRLREREAQLKSERAARIEKEKSLAAESALRVRLAQDAAMQTGRSKPATAPATASIVMQTGHASQVETVAVSPDGAYALTGDQNSIKLWISQTGVLLRTLTISGRKIGSAGFSFDGAQIYALCDERYLAVWRLDSSSVEQIIDTKLNAAGMIISNRGSLVALRDQTSKAVVLWDPTRENPTTVIASNSEILDYSFSPTTDALIALHSDKKIRFWNATTGTLLKTLNGDVGNGSLAVSRDGKYIATASDPDVKLLDGESGKTLDATTIKIRLGIDGLTLAPDGRHLILHSHSGQMMVELKNVRGVPKLGARDWMPERGVHVFTPDGKRVLTAPDSQNTNPFLWDIVSKGRVTTFGGSAGGISGLHFLPDRNQIAVFGPMQIDFWDWSSGHRLRQIPNPDQRGQIEALSANADLFVTRNPDGYSVWSANGSLVHNLATPVVSFDFANWAKPSISPDGRRLFLAGRRGISVGEVVQLWSLDNGRLLWEKEYSGDVALSAAFSFDGRFVAASHRGGEVSYVWDADSGRLIRSIKEPSVAPRRAIASSDNAVSSIAFSPDSRRLLTGSWNTRVRVWDIVTGDLVSTLEAGEEISQVLWCGEAIVFAGKSELRFSGPTGSSGSLKLDRGAVGDGIAACSKDGTLAWASVQEASFRIVKRGDLLGARAVFYSSGLDWVAATPEGFFVGRSGGNNPLTIVRGVTTFSVEQVFRSLYNPDLVAEALAGDIDGEVRKSGEVINLDKVLSSSPAPEAVILPVNSRTATDVVNLIGRIADRGTGIGRIEWRVNGVTVAVLPPPATTEPTYSVNQDVVLDPGDNIVELVAYNASNLLASQPARTTITRDQSGSAARPKLHVLAIGIDAYTDRGWTPPGQQTPVRFDPLNFAAKDAKALAAALEKAGAGLYADVRVTTALNADATITNLEATIDKMAIDVHPRDTFILFAAAHGTSLNGRFYMIPHGYQGGTDPAALASRAISQERLQDWVANRIKAKRMVILLDTCESGALVGGAARSRIDIPASEAAIGRLHEATGRPVLTAAAEGRYAYEGIVGDGGVQHGVFTWAILDALKKGDRNGNGTIELSELVAHVQSEVPALATKHGGTGRAASVAPVSTGQSARFGSRGEDFALVAAAR